MVADTFMNMSLRFLVMVGTLSLLTVFAGLLWWTLIFDRGVDVANTAEEKESQSTSRNLLSQQGAADPATVEILDYGFGEDNYGVTAAVLIQGAVSGQTAELVTASVNFLDGEGNIVATEVLSQYLKWDGQQLVIPVTAYEIPPGTVKSIDPTVVVTDNKLPGPDIESIPPARSTEISEGFTGDYQAVFPLTNETGMDWMDITVGVACYDEDGKVNGGGNSYPGPLLAGKSMRLEASVTTSSEPDYCEAFAHPALFQR